jgi:hypothetical protein
MNAASQRAANLDKFATTLRTTLSEAGRASPSGAAMSNNLTINRATRILTDAGLLPSACVSISDSKSGRVKGNRVASITVQNSEYMEGITASIDAALAAGGYKVGWYYKANGDKQTAYQTTV